MIYKRFFKEAVESNAQIGDIFLIEVERRPITGGGVRNAKYEVSNRYLKFIDDRIIVMSTNLKEILNFDTLPTIKKVSLRFPYTGGLDKFKKYSSKIMSTSDDDIPIYEISNAKTRYWLQDIIKKVS